MMNKAALLLGSAILAGAVVPAAAQEKVLVITALQPLYSITSALVEGTGIEVQAVPATLPGMGGLARALARPDEATRQGLANADAVVSIESLWPQDPLFTEARAANIRVVEIDAGRSLAKGHQSVALIGSPSGDVPWREGETSPGDSPYVWFSPSNAIKMAEIIAADLGRLAPDDAAAVTANLHGFASELQALKAEYEQKFLSLPPQSLYALTDRFVYLTNELGLFVDGYFLEQDVRWTEDDFAGFEKLLADYGVTHVLHHWEPDEKIAAAITEGGADLVVLADVDGAAGEGEAPDPQGYQKVLRADLEALYQALSQ